MMKYSSFMAKCFLIGGIVLAASIATLFVGGMVTERSERAQEVMGEVAASWSAAQKITGPVLCVPVYQGQKTVPHHFVYLAPNRLRVDADVKSQTLHRGIFDAPVYQSKVKGQGDFCLSDVVKENASAARDTAAMRLGWEKTQVLMAVGDKRGVEQSISIVIGGVGVELSQPFDDMGVETHCALGAKAGVVGCTINLLPYVGNASTSFSFEASLKGSSLLSVAPLGKSAEVSITGNSTSPSFKGFVLPSERKVDADGFSALWRVSALNRSDVGQTFTSCPDGGFDRVTVDLLVEGGQYTQTHRAINYSFLVCLLLLGAVLLAEASVGGNINLLNYMLIGAALPLFYLLLLSLGEWIGFSWAYLLAALMIVSLVTTYLAAILRNKRVALAVSLFMTLVYAFIYLLLGIADVALLVGSLALFALLAAAMFFSLKLSTPAADTPTEEFDNE